MKLLFDTEEELRNWISNAKLINQDGSWDREGCWSGYNIYEVDGEMYKVYYHQYEHNTKYHYTKDYKTEKYEVVPCKEVSYTAYDYIDKEDE